MFSKRTQFSFSTQIDDDASLELNLTPLIDIVFLLLIFFMLSTTFVDTTQLEIDLPSASSASKSTPKKITEIRIAANGQIAIAGNTIRRDELRTALQKLGDSPSLLLRADTAATHGSVVAVMDVAQQLGINSLSIAVKPTKEE